MFGNLTKAVGGALDKASDKVTEVTGGKKKTRAGPANPTENTREFASDSKKVCAGEVRMFSGCMDDQTSADVGNVASFDVPVDEDCAGTAGGACTNSMAEILYATPRMTFAELLDAMRENLSRRGFTQIPQMSSSAAVDLQAVFSLWGSFTQA